MITIPEELLEQVERGNVLLFVGERIVHDAKGRVALDQLATQLAIHCGLTDAEELSFPEVAQVFEDSKGRHALVQFVRDQLERLGDEPQQAHCLITELSDCNVLATTCLDRRLERAFKEAERPLDVIIGNVDVAFEDEHKSRLYKLRGSVERIESLVLTEDDYEMFLDDQASISVALQGYLARKTILFVGYDLADTHFKRLYRKVTAPLDKYARRAYAFGEMPPPMVSRWCERHGIKVIEADATAFLKELTKQLAARARPAPAILPHPLEEPIAPLPERPYKLLDYYEARDETIFFGRREETRTLSSLIHAHRLVLLYGASGTGKTSLLLAGMLPRLERAEPPYEIIYVRALEDPALVIRRAVRRRLPEADLPEDGSLVDFLDVMAKALGRTLVIVLDQFEEFFIRLSPQFRAAFIAELGALYDARDVSVKVVLSLREDWLASVSEIEERIPEVFRTRMRLLPLTRDQAQLAITAPVERLGVTYEPVLVERLLDDLTVEGVMPPQLQLVCSALYDASGESKRITLKMYKELGEARGVLQAYLDDELRALGRDQVLARTILEELVTSQGTKAVRTSSDLAHALQATEDVLIPLLERLVTHRLLRPVEQADRGRAYELAHEYLIREIGLSPEAQARKQAEEIIGQELDNYRRFGTLLPPDKFALVDDVRTLLRLNPEAQELLLRSALQHDVDVPYWLMRLENPIGRQAVLAEAASSQRARLRRQAAIALGLLDEASSVEPLVKLVLEDQDASVLAAAQASLVTQTNQRNTVVARLVKVSSGPERNRAKRALETLSGLSLTGLPLGLRMRVLGTRLRLRAQAAAQWVWTNPLRRSLAFTVGLLVMLIAGGYIFSTNCYYLHVGGTLADGTRPVVVRRGHPGIPLPGMGNVVVDTGFRLTQLTPVGQEDLLSKRSYGFWWQRASSGYRRWEQALLNLMAPDPMARTYWYLGERRHGFELILEWLNSDIRRYAVGVLEDVLVIHPEFASEQVFFMTQQVLEDPNSDVRVSGLLAIKQIAALRPDLAPQVVVALVGLLTDEDSWVRSSAAAALGQVVVAKPEVATAEVAEALVGLLTDQDSDVRSSAAAALGQVVVANPEVATAEVAEALFGLLTDEDSDVRGSAADALGQVVETNPEAATAEVVEALFGLLTDEDSDVRDSAADALGQIVANPEVATAEVAETLLGLLTDEDSEVRSSAAAALGQVVVTNPEVATAEVAEALLGLLTDEDSLVRHTAAYALGQVVVANPEVATAEVAEALLGLLTDEDRWVRYTAAYALRQVVVTNPEAATAEVAEALLGLLTDQDSTVRGSAAYALGQVVVANPEVATAEVAEALLGLLTDQDSEVRSSAAAALGLVVTNPEGATAEVAEVLVGLLTDEDSDVRSSAAYALWQVVANPEAATAEAIDALAGLLTDQDCDVRSSAAAALGQVMVANPEAVTAEVAEALLGLLTDQDSMVRDSAVYALGQVVVANPEAATAEVAEALVGLLTDEDRWVRYTAAYALRQVVVTNPEAATAEVAEALLGLLTDQDSTVRGSAAYALRQVVEANPEAATMQVVDTLLGLLTDQDSTVRGSAVYALGQVVVANPEVATAEVVEVLVGLLTDEDAWVRSSAAYALRQVVANPEVATVQVVDTLLGLLTDEDSDVRSSAANALGQVMVANPEAATAEVAEALLGLLTDQDSMVRGSAVYALGQVVVANPEAATVQVIDTLLGLLTDEDSWVQDTATGALARIYGHQAFQTDGTDGLFAKLTNPLNARERPIAARALFLVALLDPTRREAICSRLEALSTSQELIARTWANTTLQMIDLTGLVYEAVDEPSKREDIGDKLDMLKRAEFFGEDFTWAAQEAPSWLELQTTQEGKD